MKNFIHLGLLTAALCVAGASPGLADWDRIGSISVRHQSDHDVRNLDLGGQVDRLQFSSEHGDVYCSSVNAQFGNSSNRSIFKGVIHESPVTVDMPGDAVALHRLAFNCAAADGRGSTIRVSADISNHREEWQHNPNFERLWARMFNWTSNPNQQAGNGWQLIGSENFEGSADSERAFTGWSGRRVDAVALRPLDADARCQRVSARFGNGRTQDLRIDNGDSLRMGRYYKLDLPGDSRILQSVTLRCHAVSARRATIQIFTSK